MRKTLCEASSKKFLSDRADEHSAVCWSASAEYHHREDSTPTTSSVECVLRMQDCSRSINIEFEAYGDDVNRDMLVSRLVKIDTLIGELENFKEEMNTAYTKAIKHNEENT